VKFWQRYVPTFALTRGGNLRELPGDVVDLFRCQACGAWMEPFDSGWSCPAGMHGAIVAEPTLLGLIRRRRADADAVQIVELARVLLVWRNVFAGPQPGIVKRRAREARRRRDRGCPVRRLRVGLAIIRPSSVLGQSLFE
jgi:hypothetical protein